MSMDSTLDVQQALFAHVRSNLELQALMGTDVRFYDQRPQSVDYPYLMLQRVQLRPVDAEGSVDELSLSLLCVSRFEGTEEVKAILAVLRKHIDGAELTLAAHRLVNLRISFVDVFRAADRHTIYGLMRLRAVVEALS